MKRVLIVFMVATILVTAIFFTQNVMADDSESSGEGNLYSNPTIVAVENDSDVPINSVYSSYVVFKHTGKYYISLQEGWDWFTEPGYYVATNLVGGEGATISGNDYNLYSRYISQTSDQYHVMYADNLGYYLTLEECIAALEKGTVPPISEFVALSDKGSMRPNTTTKAFNIGDDTEPKIKYSTHNIIGKSFSYNNQSGTVKTFFQQAPLLKKQQLGTVGGMKSQQIVTATTKHMVYLVPLLIGLLVVFLGFRKGLALLLRVLKRA